MAVYCASKAYVLSRSARRPAEAVAAGAANRLAIG
jgi:hypothetical protein